MARKITRLDNSFGKYGTDVVARPVDTYVAPMRAPQVLPQEDTTYRQLAGALAGLHAPLAKFAKDKHDEKVAADEAQGKKLYDMDEHGGLSWADYVKANPDIPVNASIKKGYLMARASNEAKRIEEIMADAYNRGEATVEIDGKLVSIADTDDKAAFNTWVTGFIRDYVAENMGDQVDPQILENIFMPQVEDNVKTLAGYHLKQRNNAYVLKNTAENGALIENKFMGCVEDGSFILDNEEERQCLVKDLGTIMDNMIAQGIPADKVVDLLSEKIMAVAGNLSIKNAEELLNVGLDVTLSNGVRLGDLGNVETNLRSRLYEAERRREVKARMEREESDRLKEEKLRLAAKGIFQSAIGKKTIDVKGITEQVYAAGGNDKDAAALISIIRSTINAAKPEVDPYARSEARNAYNNRRLFAFQQEHPDGIFTMNDIASSDLDPYHKVQLAEIVLKRGPAISSFYGTHKSTIDTAIRGAVFDGEPLNESNSARYMLAESVVSEYINDALAQDPSILGHTGKALALISNAAEQAKKTIPRDDAVVQLAINTTKDYNKGRETNQLSIVYNDATKHPNVHSDDIRAAVKQWTSGGNSPLEHEFVKEMLKTFDVGTVERELGIKLPRQSQPSIGKPKPKNPKQPAKKKE